MNILKSKHFDHILSMSTCKAQKSVNNRKFPVKVGELIVHCHFKFSYVYSLQLVVCPPVGENAGTFAPERLSCEQYHLTACTKTACACCHPRHHVPRVLDTWGPPVWMKRPLPSRSEVCFRCCTHLKLESRDEFLGNWKYWTENKICFFLMNLMGKNAGLHKTLCRTAG